MTQPIDPCGLATDIGRYTGTVDMAFWRDDDSRQKVRVYWVPADRPFLPIPHRMLNGCWRELFSPDIVPLGEVGDDGFTWRSSYAPPLTWGKEGLHFCGSVRQWQEGSVAADPGLTWTEFGFSTCCEGVFALGTQNTLAKFGPDGLSVIDSRFIDNPATVTTPGTIPTFKAGIELRDSRIEDNGLTGNIKAKANLEAWGGFQLRNNDGSDAGSWIAASDAVRIQNSFNQRTTTGGVTAGIRFDVGATTNDFSIESSGAGIPGRFFFHGVLVDLNFGTAAYQASSAFDAAGTAATEVSSHEGESDPHPGYVLESANVTVPTGALMPYAGSSAPTGWLACDGSAVSRTTYAALFAAIGTVWGAGDGSTTFNVPDLRGRNVLGDGTGSGLSARTIGQTGGVETHALSVTEVPAHNHKVGMRNDGSTVGGNIQIATTGNTFAFHSAGTIGNVPTGGADGLSYPTGSGTAHPTMAPWACAKWLVKT